jgi:hypothetical protein
MKRLDFSFIGIVTKFKLMLSSTYERLLLILAQEHVVACIFGNGENEHL